MKAFKVHAGSASLVAMTTASAGADAPRGNSYEILFVMFFQLIILTAKDAIISRISARRTANVRNSCFSTMILGDHCVADPKAGQPPCVRVA